MKNLTVFSLVSVFVILSVAGSADAVVIDPPELNRAGKITSGAVDWDTLSTREVAIDYVSRVIIYGKEVSGKNWWHQMRHFSQDDLFHPLKIGRAQKVFGVIEKNDFTQFWAVLVDSCEGAYVFAMSGDSTAWAIGEQVVKLFPEVHRRSREIWGRSDFILNESVPERVMILIYPFAPLVDLEGFVAGRDVIPFFGSPSNGMPSIHVNSVKPPGNYMGWSEFLIHEFQHVIALSWDIHENSWILEGMATLSEYLYSGEDRYMGYNWSAYIDDSRAMQESAVDMRFAILGEWERDTRHYASAFYFFQWLYRVYGMDAIIQIMHDPYNGKESIARATGDAWDIVWSRYEVYMRSDFNGDFILNNADLELFLVGGLHFQSIRFDLNLDGWVDERDLFLFAQQLGISEQEAAKLVAKYASEPQTQPTVLQNYPNPFNASTTIAFPVPEQGRVRVVVYNAVGQLVQELYHGAASPGLFQIQWDGSGAASGQYFLRVEVGGEALTSRMTLVK